ncbi:MAG: hypothetical protein AB1801_23415, partial [Chloroflexota bacterium]
MKAAIALMLCFLFFSSGFSAPAAAAVGFPAIQNMFPSSLGQSDNQTSQYGGTGNNMSDNAPILYTGSTGSYATEKLVEPILDFQRALGKLENELPLLKNANGAEENKILALAENSLAEFGVSVQKLGNVAVDVFSEIDENMENYRRLVAENKIPKEHVENYGKSIGELKLWMASLLAMSSALCESVGSLAQAENIDAILTPLAEIKSQLEGRIYSHTVSLDSYRFIPSYGYQNETCYFTFTLKNDGWLSASWNGSFLITVDGNVYKSWQNI